MARTMPPLLREPSHAPLSIFAPLPPPRRYDTGAVERAAPHSPVATDDSAADNDGHELESDNSASPQPPSVHAKRRYRVMTPEQRDLAHRMVRQGFCKADAARVLDVNRRTLGASLKKLESLKNGDAPVRAQGRPPVLTGPALAMAHGWADTKGVKDVSALKTQLQHEFGIDVSVTTVRRALLDRVKTEPETSSRAVAPTPGVSQRPVDALSHEFPDALSTLGLLLLDQRSRSERYSFELVAPMLRAAAPPHRQLATAPIVPSAPVPATRPKRPYRVMTPAERDFAHRMVRQGFCKADAARVLDVNRSTLAASLKKLETRGDSARSAPARAQGRPPALTGPALAMAHDWADTKGVRDVSMLKAQLQSAFHKDVSVTTIRRVLLERVKSGTPSGRRAFART